MADPIQGTSSGDVIFDTAGDDKLLGHSGDDLFFLSVGNDTVNGQGGFDTAVFAGAFSSYAVDTMDTGNLKTLVSGLGEWAELKNIERLLFDNGSYDVASGAFTVNTVSVSGGQSVTEGGDLTFTFTRTGDLSRAVDVFYTAGGSANAADFSTAIGTHVSFAAGSNTATVTLHTVNDGIYEGTQNIDLQIVADPGHFDVVGSGVATDTIFDAQTVPTISVSDAQTTEGGVVHFQVTLSGPSETAVTVDFQTMGITAFNTSDYMGRMGTLTFAPGETSKVVNVQTIDDAVHENTETFALNLSNPSGATIADAQGIGTIFDNDAAVVTHVGYYMDAAIVPEGANLQLHVHRDVTTSALDLTFNYGPPFPLGSATPGVDFVDPSHAIHFNAGQSDATVTFHTIPDGITEGAEAFNVNILSPDPANVVVNPDVTAYLAANPGANPTQVNIGHIAADTPPTTHVGYYMDAGFVTEGSDLQLHVHRDITTSALDVNFIYGPPIPGGSATPGFDFVDPSHTIHFDAGQSDATVTFHTIADGITEGAEAFTVAVLNAPFVLTNPDTAGYLAHGGTDGTQVNIGHIAADPTPVTTNVGYYMDAGFVTEGGDLQLHVHRDVTTSALDLNFIYGPAFPSGSATPGDDFVDPSHVIHFDAGQADATVTFHTIQDGVTEGGEAFSVSVLNAPFVLTNPDTAGYLAHGGTDGTQVNIGHINDFLA
jgi:hypothetical protein